MKLTNEKRGEVTRHLVEMVYPTSFYNDISMKILEVLESTDEMKTSKMLVKKYPRFVEIHSEIKFYYDDRYGNIVIHTDFKYAWPGELYIGLRYKEIEHPKFEDFAKQIREFQKNRDAYQEKVSSVIRACNTSKQLYDTLPEIKGFFGPEGQEKVTDIIPMTLIEEVRRMIPKEKK